MKNSSRAISTLSRDSHTDGTSYDSDMTHATKLSPQLSQLLEVGSLNLNGTLPRDISSSNRIKMNIKLKGTIFA